MERITTSFAVSTGNGGFCSEKGGITMGRGDPFESERPRFQLPAVRLG